jgi:adenosylcobinamide-GDP ribazoletransferase
LSLLAAFQFLTILPVKLNFTSQQLGRASAYFPVVGAVIGLVLAGINYLLNLILPEAAVNIILIALLVLFSGGLHLDGLADTMDGIAGHRTPERRLEIMRDSRIGGFAAIGVALVLLMEYVFLNSIPGNFMFAALIVAPTLSRWAVVNAIFVYPYARLEGLGTSFKEGVSWRQFVIASVVSLIPAVVLFKVAGVVIMAGVWITVTIAAIYLKSQLRGLTGDTYGAINELATSVAFLLITMLTFKHWLI